MLNRIAWAWISLVALALGAGLFWRLEVEYHGWAGLTWIRYEHRAVTVAAVLFIAWIAVFCDVTPRSRRTKFIIVLLILAPIFKEITRVLLSDWFVMGPRAMLFGPRIFGPAIFIHYLSMPLILWLVASYFGQRISVIRGLVSLALFLAAFPVALVLLSWTGAHEVDAIHTIKSGFIVPLLVLGLGVLFDPAAKTGRDRSVDVDRVFD